ncbi:hypothetical protein AVEN_77670-1 [Araneus ventricosus]|uniref:Uncharacterized protein n=1 Tax=Araneus ventricosus TaxID=182803 RepID=A0A4Y2PF29_ARAVE|nr:hypothetical protein AVEN_77670-1 [Araneus ventricosus]
MDPVIKEIESSSTIMGLEVDNIVINEIMEEHGQELITEELMELLCGSYQEVEERLSEEEEVTAKEKYSGAIKVMLKAWKSVASCIEKHHPSNDDYELYKFIQPSDCVSRDIRGLDTSLFSAASCYFHRLMCSLSTFKTLDHIILHRLTNTKEHF